MKLIYQNINQVNKPNNASDRNQFDKLNKQIKYKSNK